MAVTDEINFVSDQHPAVVLWRQIFNRKYYIEAKAMHTYSDYQLEVSGIPYTGHEMYDRYMAHELNTHMCTIADMAQYYRDDVTFYFTNRHDIPKIREYIIKYIDMMVEAFNRNHISPSKFKSDDVLRNVVDDLEALADLGNHIGRTARKVQRANAPKEKDERIYKKLRTLSMSRFARKTDESSINDVKHIDITENMTTRVRDGSRIWRRRET